MSQRNSWGWLEVGRFVALGSALALAGCAAAPKSQPPPPDVAPAASAAGADALALDASKVEPMYSELLPIDLPTVIRVAAAENIDVQLARRRIEQSSGQYESAVGSAFPAIVPMAVFRRIDGRNQNSNGDLFNVGFNSFQPYVAVQWVTNPGQVIYEIVAAKKRLQAVEHEEQAVKQETLRTAAVQFYELAFAQARISAAHQAVVEAEELVRINRIRSETGAGVPADELRAQARLAERQQDLALAMNALYNASLALTVTLQLDDPTVTLVPKLDELPRQTLVRPDLDIDRMLGCAIAFRPDLRSVRELVEAAGADRGRAWWSGFGPEFELAYQYGGITANANNIDKAQGIPGNLIVNPFSANGSFSGNPVANGLIKEGVSRASRQLEGNRDVTFKFGQRTEFTSSVGARWSLSAFGDLKAAGAVEEQARLRAEQAVNEVKAQVVAAAQAGKTHQALIALSKRQSQAAEEALRLTRANMQAGTMTTIDVLQAQDAVAQSRLRHAEAVVRYNQAQVNLLAALGLISESAFPSCPP